MLRSFLKFTSVLRRHPRLALLALALGVLGAGTATVLLWAQSHRTAARRALDQYAFDEAQHHLELYLRVHPGDADAHLLAARAARRHDAYAEADQHLEACARLGGKPEAVALERRLLAAQQGNLDGLLGPLRARTGEDDPEAVPVLEALAKGFVNGFRPAHALVCLNILLEREPRHPLAWLMRARLWEDRVLHGETDRDQEALRDYQKAVELNPSFEARLGLARTHYRVGRPWDALLEYERLRRERPDDAGVLLGLARCRYALGEVDEARRLLDGLLRQHPQDAAALLERGRLARHEGRLDEAETWLRQASALAPRYDCEAHHLLYRCLEEEHKTEEARRCLDDLREREAEVLRVERLTLRASRGTPTADQRFEIAVGLMRLGREQDAVATLVSVLEQNPQHRAAHEALADYFERTGQPGRATRHRRASLLGAGAYPLAR
jgi:tetratricopeptide (TPR) repeat protein